MIGNQRKKPNLDISFLVCDIQRAELAKASEPVNADVLYADAHIVAVNKPVGYYCEVRMQFHLKVRGWCLVEMNTSKAVPCACIETA